MTRNYRQFYALLGQLPGVTDKEETKRDLVRQFTNGRTDSLQAMQTWEYQAMLASMNGFINASQVNPASLDKPRKRLIACIGGYLKASGSECNINIIKATACRAAGVRDFNDIPADRLNSLYNAFKNRQNDIKKTQQL